ncbi:hypothetical protein D3C84_671850 [compost metagenome]
MDGRVVDALAGAHHQFMAAPERLEGPTGKGVYTGLVFIEVGLVNRAGQGVVVPARLIRAGEQRVLFGVVGVDLKVPVIGQAMTNFGEYGVDLLILVLPIRPRIVGTWQVQMMAVLADHRRAPEVIGLVLLVGKPQGQGGVLVQVRFGDRIEQAMILLDIVDEAVGVLVRGHDPAAQRATVVERAGGIDLATVVVPTAGGTGQGDSLLGQWPLADQVDGGRRVACTRHQTGGTAHYLDSIKHRQVRLRADVYAVVATRDAVIHQVVDFKTACLVGLPARTGGKVQEQTGRRLDHVVDVGHRLVIHTLARNDGDGLWGFTHRQWKFGRGRHRTGGVGLGAFRGTPQLTTAGDLGCV